METCCFRGMLNVEAMNESDLYKCCCCPVAAREQQCTNRWEDGDPAMTNYIFVIRCPIYLGDWRTFLPGLLYIPCPQLLGCGQILLRVVTFCVVTPRAVSIYYALSTIYHRELRLPIIDASPCPRPPPRWWVCARVTRDQLGKLMTGHF